MKVKRTIELIQEFPGLGQKIKKARENDERSLSQICRECGISRSYWYKIENEEIIGSIQEETVKKIEQVLNIDLKICFSKNT